MAKVRFLQIANGLRHRAFIGLLDAGSARLCPPPNLSPLGALSDLLSSFATLKPSSNIKAGWFDASNTSATVRSAPRSSQISDATRVQRGGVPLHDLAELNSKLQSCFGRGPISVCPRTVLLVTQSLTHS